jgi:DNA-cytosine methyltransferase
MKYISVCSGIEAASVAWHELGWEPVAFSEIEPFPSEVLKIRFPHVPNWGDMTKFDSWPNVEVNLLVGGTPCQSFSVAGLRQGLKDPRGNLMLTFLAIADKYRPQWIVWENVPGVLSSNGGKDFESFLDGLEAIGYICDVEILDAQNFGVAQRRRRVFVCGQSVESILEQRTVLSALTISQCLVEILHGILIEVLYLYEREPLKLGLAHLSKDGVSRRMSLFGLLTEDCNYGKWQKLLVDVFQKHQPEQNIWDLPSGGKTERELTVEDLLMGLNQEGQSTLTEGSLNEALEELYDLMRLFTTSTLTREIIQSKISLFFKVGESIGRLICRLSGLSPNSSSAILSFLTLQTELTNYARKTGGNLFSEMEGFYPYDDFIRKAERTSAIIGNFGDRGTSVQVLFESESVSRNPTPSREKRQAVAPSPAPGVGVGGEWWDGGQTASTVTTRSGGQYMPDKDNFGAVLTVNTRQFLDIQENVTGTLLAKDYKEPQMVAHGFLPTQGSKAHGLGIEKELSPTLRSGCDSYGVYTQPTIIDRAAFNQGENAQYEPNIEESETMPSLVARGPHAVAQPITIDRSSVNMGYDFNRDLGIEQSGVTPTILATGPHSVAHAFKIRGGSPTETGEYGGTPGKAAGKGYLGSDDLAFTIAASQDQHIAQQIPFRKSRKAKSQDDFETWKPDQVANTLNLFDQGDIRTSQVVVQQPIAVDCYNQTVNEHTTQTIGSSASDVNHYGAVLEPTITQQPTMAIRRLTPVECERLQGFPDNWTLIPWKKKPIEECPDGPRYKACGNSMAVPCMRWIGKRIADAQAKIQ